MFEDLFDMACASELDVSIQEYIDKIESISPARMEIIITHLLGENETKRKQAKRVFNLIP